MNESRLPNFFIIGAPKCGTTAMNTYLKAHPGLFVPDRKEIQYFGTDLEHSARPTRDQYLSYFAGANDDQRPGEASVWYLYSQRAAEEIKQFAPDASIIIMLRNPVDMLHSIHSQMLFTGHEDIPDFLDALNAEDDRKAGRRIPSTTRWRNVPFCNEYLYYREIAKYEQQVKRYLDSFTQDNVHIILFDDLKHDTADVYRRTLQFLGVDDRFQPDLKVLNSNKQPRSRLLRSLLLNPPKVVQKTAKVLFPGKLHRRVFERLKRLNTNFVPRSPMDPTLRQDLMVEFRPEVERLSELIGRDLTCWCDH